eukprot:COSAG05_NODE_311_length_11636_cov_11.922250_7_plen_77_part_00
MTHPPFAAQTPCSHRSIVVPAAVIADATVAACFLEFSYVWHFVSEGSEYVCSDTRVVLRRRSQVLFGPAHDRTRAQ